MAESAPLPPSLQASEHRPWSHPKAGPQEYLVPAHCTVAGRASFGQDFVSAGVLDWDPHSLGTGGRGPPQFPASWASPYGSSWPGS